MAIAVALLLPTTPAWAWGPVGHHIVAIIAEQRLSTATRERVRSLLLDGKYSLADISTCADQIRGNSPDAMCRALAGDVPSTNGTWHYIDIPVPATDSKLDAFCPDDNCVTARIRSFSEILRTSKDAAQRRQALLFLVHFVGDIHQPLHAAERGCDHGGNLEHVNFLKETNVPLHHVWDSSELELAMQHANISDERVFAGILIAGIKPGEASRWASASADQMAWESYRLAVARVYRGVPFQNFCGDPKLSPIIVNYENNGSRLVREQLMKAGVRLAAILEADLGQSSGLPASEAKNP